MTLWRGNQPLILASQSRARQMILTNAGLAFEALPANIDERGAVATAKLTGAADIAKHLAREKALHVSRTRPGHYVIGADQTLALGTRQFNKPAGREQAASQLKSLAGNTHELHSALSVALDGQVLFDHVAVARMTMRPMDDAAIGAYLDAAGEVVTTSVGAYQLEGLGVHLFERIDGDHFTILGLPLPPLLDFMRGRGLLAF